MPRPWVRDRDDADDRDAAGDRAEPPPAAGAVDAVEAGSGAEGGAEGVGDDDPGSFPTLDPPWPDGDIPDLRWPDVGGRVGPPGDPEPDDLHVVWPGESGKDGEPGEPGKDGGAGGELDGEESLSLRPGPERSAPEPCRVPRRQVHRRRSRHSFEPADLSDADLDRLLRGPSRAAAAGVGSGAGAGRPGPAAGRPRSEPRPWPVWAKAVLAAAALLVGLGVVGALNAAAGDTTDTITTRGQGGRSTRSPTVPPPPTSRLSPPSSVPATDASSVLPPTRSFGSEVLRDRSADLPLSPPATPVTAAPSTSTTSVAPSCHPSYEPCVPVADDVDCAGGSGNGPAYVDVTVEVVGPDVYGLDADQDGRGCE